MQDYEKLGVFYLGKEVSPSTGQPTENLVLYPSKDLTTHAVCVGMTGSGKTGLGIALLEEAGIDKIPAIIIDPKGDLSNLLLTFPNLSTEDFLPWIDQGEAERKGMDTKAYAESVAKQWKEGLAKWGESAQRIKNLRNSVDMVIYTPASKAGIPLSILSSFAPPSKEVMLDSAALQERIKSITSSLLGLLGIDADPIKSREHILISNIIDRAWQSGQTLDLASLIQQVQKPPFEKIGALDIDTFFSPKERMSLSISLNNLLASPGFKAWMEGEPLDIKQILYSKEGKPKLSIISIAHLSDSERMFFVTLLLNEILSWMRSQPGTSSLRALLYMDEIFGFFPPTAMPPSKMPMLTLLKQARAFGLGIVLATQNPVDLDYKGLSNCGTWFIGKLQTDRDKSRVIEGLKVASNGEIDASTLDKMLASTGNRIFILRSIHEKEPRLFETRWTLSYLRGPLTLAQIDKLSDKTALSETSPAVPAAAISPQEKTAVQSTKPVIPPGVAEFFIRSGQQGIHYQPRAAGFAKLHYVDSKNKIDTWQDICLVAPAEEDGKSVLWEKGENVPEVKGYLEKTPAEGGTFDELPSGLAQEKNYSTFEKALATYLYQNQEMKIFQASDFNMVSKDGESEADFRTRISLTLREKRDEMTKKLQDKYKDKISSLTEKMRRAQDKMAQKQQEAGLKKAETFISFGATLLGAFFGKGITKGTINQAGTSMRRVGKLSKDSQDATQAEQDFNNAQQQLEELKAQMEKEVTDTSTSRDADAVRLETITVRPRKSDISVEKVVLLWCPFH